MDYHLMRAPTPPESGSRFDTVIVGSGAAGLLAAYAILSRVPGARLLIADSGPALDTRRRLAANTMGGYGGAGLYLGGRLYLGSATLPVAPPGQSPRAFRIVLDGEPYDQRARRVDALLTACGARAAVRAAPDQPILDAVEAAARAGLDYVTSYPARLLSADERREVLAALMRRLQRLGATFLFETEVTSAVQRADGFDVAITPVGTDPDEAARLRARTLLLAPGRYGAEWLVNTMRGLDAPVVPLPPAFGVRIEVPAEIYAPLTNANPDPRIQRDLPAGDGLIKTYATCPGGLVVPVTRYDTLVASGVPLPLGARRLSTTVAVLAQPGTEGMAGAWRGAPDIARRLNERYERGLVVQRLADARAGRPTDASALAGNSVRPTCREAAPGRLDDLYPEAYWAAFDDFLARLGQLAPGLDADDTLLYGPAEERFWHFPTDNSLQSSVPGLFVAGDGAGQSQGIIQAGVAGALAGDGIAALLARA